MTRALVFTATTDYRHDSIPDAVAALEAAQDSHGLLVTATEDPARLHDLSGTDVVVFVSTSGDVLDDPARASLRAFVEGGGGFSGVHCAAFTELSWDWYGGLLGARFAGHPEGCQPGVAVVVDSTHPSTLGLPVRWDFEDEWYAFSEVRDDLHVLLTADEDSYEPGEHAMGPGHPQAWHRRVGEGRSWYTALGHSSQAWQDPVFLGHVLGGITSVARRVG